MKPGKQCGAVLSMLLLLSLTACATAPQPVPEPEASEAEVPSIQMEEQDPAAAQMQQQMEIAAAVSSDPWDTEISIDGVVYAIPTPLSRFEREGWKLQEGSDDRIAYTHFGTGSHSVILVREGQFLEVKLGNYHTMDLAPARSCTVTYVKYTEEGTNLAVGVAGGVTIGSRREEVLAGWERTSEWEDTILWDMAELLEYRFEVDPATDTVRSISIEAGGMGEGYSSYDGELPDMVRNYRAPAQLGEDWQSGTIRLDGSLYQFPVPVLAFLEAGWEPDDAELYPELIPARSSLYNGSLILVKNGRQIDTAIYNYADIAQPLENCMVISVLLEDMGIAFELPGEITGESTLNVILEQYGEPGSISYEYYHYQEGQVNGLAGRRIIFKFGDPEAPMQQVNLLFGIDME